MYDNPQGKCPRCLAQWDISNLVENGYQCSVCGHQLKTGSCIAVYSASDSILSPCTEGKAEQEIVLGRAVWRGRKVLRLLYSPERRSLYRQVVAERDGGRCLWCGGVGTTVDHILPDSKGGMVHPANLLWSCEACNQLRRNREIDEFLHMLEQEGNPPEQYERIIQLYAEAVDFVEKHRGM